MYIDVHASIMYGELESGKNNVPEYRHELDYEMAIQASIGGVVHICMSTKHVRME